jgi:beta-aspartyl-peptidase (threonine type)
MLKAAGRGAEILRHGGAALDAVLAAVVAMEDDPLFNAGFGSVLTTEGRVEMDASVMVSGPQLMAGAVALVSRVRNPVLLARAIMEHTPHVMMVGKRAERLARSAGLKLCKPEDLVSDRARERWRQAMNKKAQDNKGKDKASPDTRRRRVIHGTVGAVARDANGQLAAATSTGGMTGKMPGRVGDSAVIGAGTYADRFGAASATGVGEPIIKAGLCREVVRLIRSDSPNDAAAKGIKILQEVRGEGGVIVIDSEGRVGYAYNTEMMDVVTFDSRRGLRHIGS